MDTTSMIGVKSRTSFTGAQLIDGIASVCESWNTDLIAQCSSYAAPHITTLVCEPISGSDGFLVGQYSDDVHHQLIVCPSPTESIFHLDQRYTDFVVSSYQWAMARTVDRPPRLTKAADTAVLSFGCALLEAL